MYAQNLKEEGKVVYKGTLICLININTILRNINT